MKLIKTTPRTDEDVPWVNRTYTVELTEKEMYHIFLLSDKTEDGDSFPLEGRGRVWERIYDMISPGTRKRFDEGVNAGQGVRDE